MNNIEFDGYNGSDSDYFCNVFICSAEHDDGTPYTEAELDELNDDSETVQRLYYEQLY